MAINYKFTTGSNILNISTNKLVSIGTGAATAVIVDSSNRLLEITNNGPANLFWGSSSMVMGSGGFLAVYSTKVWSELGDDFTIYLRADSASTVANINEYR